MAWFDDILHGADGAPGAIAALRSVRGTSTGDAVTCAGISAADDGGAGTFYWDSLSNEADNGGTCINPTGNTGAGRWKRPLAEGITPRMFGAKGDGATDDTAAFAAAIAALGTGVLTVPPGTYRLASALTIGSNDIHIQGHGQDSIIKVDASYGIVATSKSRIRIERLTFVGGAAGTIGIRVTSPSDLKILGCKFQDFNYGSGACNAIYVDGASSDVLIQNCVLDNVGNSSNSIYNIDVYFAGTGSSSVHARPVVDGLVVRNSKTIGNVFLFDASEAKVRNCHIEGWASSSDYQHYGIMVYSNAPTYGLLFRAQIANNTVRGTRASGIYVQGVSDSVICGNIVEGCAWGADDTSLPTGGIAVNNLESLSSRGCTVVGNTVRNCGAAEFDGLLRDGLTSRKMGHASGIEVAGRQMAISGNQINLRTTSTTQFRSYGIRLRGDCSFSSVCGNTVRYANGFVNVDTSATDISISGNSFENPAGIIYGTALTPAANNPGINLASGVTRVTITGNLMVRSPAQGILAISCSFLNITGNTIQDPGNNTSGNSLAMQLSGVTDSLIVGNACNGPNYTMSRGLYEYNSSTRNVITNNNFGGAYSVAALDVSGASTVTRGNRRGINTGGGGPMRGTAVLVGGTVTVSTTEVLAGDVVMVTRTTTGGTPGHLSVGTITAGTSFVINSSSGTDTSTVAWEIVH